MSLLPKLRIRGKLLLTFLILLIPVLILTDLLWINSIRPMLMENNIRGQQRLSQTAVTQISAFINEKTGKLSLAAQDIDILGKNIESAQIKMQALLRLESSLDEVSLIDADGQELTKINHNRKFSDKELTNIKASQKFEAVTYRYGLNYIGPVYFSKENAPMVTIAVPLTMPNDILEREKIIKLNPSLKEAEGGSIIGILSAEFNLSKLFLAVSNNKTGKDEYLYILDENNRIISHPNSELIKNKQDVSSVDIIKEHKKADEKILAEQGAHSSDLFTTHQGLSETGVDVLATYKQIPFLSWGVVIEQPIAQVFASFNKVIEFALVLFISGLIVTVLVSLWLSHLFTRPIRLLQKGAEIIGTGRLDYRLNIPTHDEVEQVGISFNSMAANLKSAFTKLEQDKNIISGERNKLAVTLESIADGVIVVDLNQNIVIFNKAAQSLTGLKAEDAIGQAIGQIIQVYDNNNLLPADIYCPISTGTFEGVIFVKQSLRLLGRKESYVNLTAGQIREGINVNIGCILTLHDITEGKQLEHMKLDFVSMAAHELRTPLTNILGYTETLSEELKDKLDDKEKVFLERSLISAKQLNALVANLLNISKIENKKLSISPQPIDWVKNISSLVNNFYPEAKEKGLLLRFNTPTHPLPMAFVDPLQINEVLNNLINNAFNYTKEGGMIEVSTGISGDRIITEVKDNGIGIPEEALPHLFTKFFRVAGALDRSSNSKGTGLGLYISKTIVEAHKGKIWVQSKVNQGSSFGFSIPIAK